MGDFNMEPKIQLMDNFLQTFNLYNLVKEPTCYKGNTPKCIDLMLTNKKHSFKNTITVETGLSDFHKLTATNLKTEFIKAEPIKIKYRDYKYFNPQMFNQELQQKFCESNEIKDYTEFSDIVTDTLQLHAPLKQKLIRANNVPFIDKE